MGRAWASRVRSELDELDALRNVGDWVKTLLNVHGHEIFLANCFNADPHPGNILVLEDGRLGLIDYGQSKRLSVPERERVARFICSVADDAPDEEVASALRD